MPFTMKVQSNRKDLYSNSPQIQTKGYVGENTLDAIQDGVHSLLGQFMEGHETVSTFFSEDGGETCLRCELPGTGMSVVLKACGES